MQRAQNSEYAYHIHKATLAAMNQHRGKLVDGGELDGKVFIGFAGRRHHGDRDDGLYHGVLQYHNPVDGQNYDTVTFNELIDHGFLAQLVDEESED